MSMWNELPFYKDDIDDDAKEDKDGEESGVNLPELELSPQDRAQLRSRSYEVGTPLGSGSYGTVYHGTWNKTVALAVKTIAPKEDNLKYVITELSIIKHFKHNHVIQVYDLFVTSTRQLLIFMELALGGNLKDYIWKKDKKKRPLSESTAMRFYKQFVDAFKCMHQLGIAHLDIKPENILLDAKWKVCKVSDFGLAFEAYDKQTGQPNARDGYRGTASYVAPEVLAWMIWIKAHRYCPFKADVWSAGVVFYEMINRAMPFAYKFKDPNTGEMVKDLCSMHHSQVNKQYTIGNISETVCSIIKMHLEPNPKRRPNFQQILDYVLDHCSVSSKGRFI